jgi:hypothetical protein
MSDIADKIYSATGVALGAEAAAKIGHMMRMARQKAADEIEKLRAERDMWRETATDAARVLHKAGEQFVVYANAHTKKGTSDGDQKAVVNQQWAQRCFNAHDAALGEKE